MNIIKDNIMKPYKKIFEHDVNYCESLLEKTFNINKDVNMIYNLSGFKFFVKFFNNVLKGKTVKLPDNLERIIKKKKDLVFETFTSDQLKDKDSKKAHEINPVVIVTGIFENGPFYSPINSYIQISLNYAVLKILADIKIINKTNLQYILPVSDYELFLNEITEHKLKATIAHELSHWISDSLYNSQIKKTINLAIKLDKHIKEVLRVEDVNMSYFEIDAQIHGIKQIKRKKNKYWDTYTLTDLFFMYPPLRATTTALYNKYSKEVLDIWLKNLITRMNRENLLGKNMKKFPSIEELTEDVSHI